MDNFSKSCSHIHEVIHEPYSYFPLLPSRFSISKLFPPPCAHATIFLGYRILGSSCSSTGSYVRCSSSNSFPRLLILFFDGRPNIFCSRCRNSACYTHLAKYAKVNLISKSLVHGWADHRPGGISREPVKTNLFVPCSSLVLTATLHLEQHFNKLFPL